MPLSRRIRASRVIRGSTFPMLFFYPTVLNRRSVSSLSVP